MSEPWFDPNHYGWIPGTAFGVAAGLWGGAVGLLAPRGRARGVVLGLTWLFMACAVILLAAALVAWRDGQPYGVWYGLGLPGAIGLAVLGGNIPNVLRAYRSAELRQMEARDLSL